MADFERAFHQHKQQVFRWALRFTGGRRALAEDLTQDVFMKALTEWKSLDAHDDLGGWLYRVTANTALSRLQRERFSLRRLQLFGRDSDADAPDVELAHDAAVALTALTALPPKERVVLTMKLVDGHSNREVARALNLSEGYATKLTQRGIERLRERGWEIDDA